MMTWHVGLILVAAATCIQAAAANAEPFAPGYEDISVPVRHRAEMLAGAIWYPAAEDGRAMDIVGEDHPIFYGVEVRRGASIADGSFPIVLMSHGIGGNFRGMGWLNSALAERGAVVVSVNHPNSTSGDVDLPGKALNHGARVLDLSTALDWLLSDPRFEGHVDPSRVIAAGFSYGGWTALSLGGATASLDGYARHCESVDNPGYFCADLARAGVVLRDYDAEAWDKSYKDSRVTSVVSIDPGLTHGLTEQNVADLVSDVTLVGLGNGDDRLLSTNTSGDGSRFEALLPEAKVFSISPAGHFSALLTCKPQGAAILEEEGDDPVCDDPAGADRNHIHDQMIAVFAAEIGR